MNDKTKEPPDFYGQALQDALAARRPFPELTAALCAQLSEALWDLLPKENRG